MAAISIKTGMLLLLGILAVSPARAKVTPIHEYELKQLTEGKIEYSCSNYNYFTSTQPTLFVHR